MKRKIKTLVSASNKYSLVKNDLYDIAERIKEIDSSYFILLNRCNGRYEVHSTENIGETFCFVVPYRTLDVRTLNYCRETRVERDVAAMIDDYNDKLEKSWLKGQDNLLHDASFELADRMSFAVDEDMLHDGYKHVYMMN